MREQERQERLTRARNTPPDNEIWSSQALNEMLTNIQRIEAREGVRGYKIPLDPEMVKHLNVSTTSDDSGSNEFFKATTIPDWPIAFITDDFAADRKRIQDDINALVKAQKAGRIDQLAVVDIRKAKEELKSKLFGIRFNVSSPITRMPSSFSRSWTTQSMCLPGLGRKTSSMALTRPRGHRGQADQLHDLQRPQIRRGHTRFRAVLHCLLSEARHVRY